MRENKKRIAIIGCGIGGATLVYHLNSLYPDFEIVVYEKNEKLGGRISNIKLEDGKSVEIGAQFFNGKNMNLMKFIEEYKINYTKINKSKSRMVIFDGKNNVFDTNRYFVILRYLLRYGILSDLKIRYLIYSKKRSFNKLYERIDLSQNTEGFKNAGEFVEYTGLENFIQNSGREIFLKNGYYERYIDEFMTGVLNLIYNQNLGEINGMAALVGLTGILEDSYIFQDGGNQLINSIVMNRKNVEVNLNSTVKIISKNKTNSKFKISLEDQNSKKLKNSDEFDLVILAGPIDQCQIKLQNIKNTRLLNNCNKYKNLWVYIISGRLNEKTFDIQETENTNILFCHKFDNQLKDIGCITYKHTLRGDFVYSVESSRKLGKTDFNLVFRKYNILKEQNWKFAYPILNKIDSSILPDFRICEGFYYVNSMEHISSCMELESISAQNIVKLIKNNEFKSL